MVAICSPETSAGKVISKKPTIRTSPRGFHYGSELAEDNHLHTSSDKHMARGRIRTDRTKTSDILPYEIFRLSFPYVLSILLFIWDGGGCIQNNAVSISDYKSDGMRLLVKY